MIALVVKHFVWRTRRKGLGRRSEAKGLAGVVLVRLAQHTPKELRKAQILAKQEQGKSSKDENKGWEALLLEDAYGFGVGGWVWGLYRQRCSLSSRLFFFFARCLAHPLPSVSFVSERFVFLFFLFACGCLGLTGERAISPWSFALLGLLQPCSVWLRNISTRR